MKDPMSPSPFISLESEELPSLITVNGLYPPACRSLNVPDAQLSMPFKWWKPSCSTSFSVCPQQGRDKIQSGQQRERIIHDKPNHATTPQGDHSMYQWALAGTSASNR